MNIRNITPQVLYVGVNDRVTSLFEGLWPLRYGVSYNSYIVAGSESLALIDTVRIDNVREFLNNVQEIAADRNIDYLVINHMEPDHSGSIPEVVRAYPDIKIVGNAQTISMVRDFYHIDDPDRFLEVKEGSTISLGDRTLKFFLTPMVHWPETMMTYVEEDKVLFSGDAFGTFGALNGALFADEVDFDRDHLDEARRYYTNIVGKYGVQVQSLLKKVAALDIQMICPLHGFVWRKDLGYYIEKYQLWSSYQPEEKGVMIAYASVYGNTANAADVLACRLRDRGIPTVMFDVSVAPASDIVSASFQWSHLVFASTTYNGGVFVSMDEVLRELVTHNLQNRTVAFLDNGSWAPVATRQMRQILEPCKNMTYLDETVSLLSTLKDSQDAQIDALADAIARSVKGE